MKGFVMLSPSVVSGEIGVDVVIILLPSSCMDIYIWDGLVKEAGQKLLGGKGTVREA